MSDAELLFLVLSCFYLAECAFWVQPGTCVFTSQLGGPRRRVNLRWALLRNPHGGVLLGNVLPFGQASLCQQWPVSLSPQGVYSFVSQAFGSDGRPPQPERFIRFEDIRQVEARDQELTINGALFARVAVPSFTRHLAQLLRTLRQLPEQEARGQAIAAALAQHLDPDAVRDRLALFRWLTADLQLSCLLLFFLVFLLAPLLFWLDSSLPWLTLAGCYLGLVFLTLLQYRRAHLLLYPEEKLDRLKNLLLLLVSPADAIHARDKLSRSLLGAFNPLAVARVALSQAAFEQFAGEAWRDLEYPILPVCPVPDLEPQKVEAWFRECLRQQVARFLRTAGVQPTLLLQPPPPDEATACSYCPRCLGQFVRTSGTCAACGERPLVARK